MSFGALFDLILYQPLLNSLMFLYRFFGGNMGFAIIVLTIVIKLILFYPSLAQLKAQRALQGTQPKLKELQERYKNDKEAYNKAVLQFYKENKVNPFASCLPLLIQLPILIALYRVFIAGVVTDASTGLMVEAQLRHLYAPLRDIFTSTPIDTSFLGLIDLSARHNIVLALLAGGVTFWQAKMLMARKAPTNAGSGAKDEDRAAAMNRSMAYVTPLLTFFFSYTFPAGLALYWFVVTLFQIGQQYYFLRRHPVLPTPTSPSSLTTP